MTITKPKTEPDSNNTYHIQSKSKYLDQLVESKITVLASASTPVTFCCSKGVANIFPFFSRFCSRHAHALKGGPLHKIRKKKFVSLITTRKAIKPPSSETSNVAGFIKLLKPPSVGKNVYASQQKRNMLCPSIQD